MLRALTLENFKAFGSPTRVDFSPITLIFGENSAGKSSILQALNLLKQTYESRDAGAGLLPRAEDGIVDLGSFSELLFDHDSRRTLRLALTTGPSERWASLRWSHLQPSSPFFSMAYSRDADSGEVRLKELEISMSGEDNPLARLSARPLTKDEQRDIRRHFLWRPREGGPRDMQMGAQCSWVTSDEKIWGPIHSAWLAKREQVVEALKNLSEERVSFESRAQDAKATQSAWLHRVGEAISFYSSPFSQSAFVARMQAWAKDSVIALNGFLPMASGRTQVARGLPEQIVAEEYRRSRDLARSDLPLLDVGAVAFMAGGAVEEALLAMFPMGPFRRPPERWYMFTGSSPIDVGYKGDHLPDLLFRKSHLLKAANEWLERLGIGYRLRVRPIGERHSDLFEVRLVDSVRKADVDVALSDVGFGISQILPFVVQCLASQQRIISIEQPEVHIHPRLQASLGDLLAEAIADPYKHQFLIETHSEHLILRVQKLVRTKKLRASDVSVIHVSRGPDGSRAKRIHLDDSGDFVDEWPGGFFPERLREFD